MFKQAPCENLPRPLAFLKNWLSSAVAIILVALVHSGCYKEPSGSVDGTIITSKVSGASDLGEICNPSFVPLAEDSVKVQPDPYLEMGASVILIGCGSDLQQIEPREKAKLVRYFESVIEENHYLLERKRLSLDFRKEMVHNVNLLLGRRQVTDVFVYGAYSTELGPE
jgi:hypothetical protein